MTETEVTRNINRDSNIEGFSKVEFNRRPRVVMEKIFDMNSY